MPSAIVPIAAHCIVRSTRLRLERKTGLSTWKTRPDHDEPDDDRQLTRGRHRGSG